MSTFDRQWKEVVSDILRTGEKQEGKEITSKYIEDDKPAATIYKHGYQMRFDSSEFPMLFSKNHLVKLAWEELRCIMIKKTNIIQDFRDVGIKFWDQWEYDVDENNRYSKWNKTMGPAYGYQVKNKKALYPTSRLKVEHLDKSKEYPEKDTESSSVYLDQLDMLVQKLVNYKEYGIGRSNIITLLDPSHVDEMAIFPCVWNSEYYVSKGKLIARINIRSNDMPVGNPFNITQYYMFMVALCHVADLEFGEMIVSIGDAHVYDRHVPGVKRMLDSIASGVYDDKRATIRLREGTPKNIYEIDFKDFIIEGYEKGETINFPLAYTKSPNKMK